MAARREVARVTAHAEGRDRHDAWHAQREARLRPAPLPGNRPTTLPMVDAARVLLRHAGRPGVPRTSTEEAAYLQTMEQEAAVVRPVEPLGHRPERQPHTNPLNAE
jgi:hypothetical protein